MRVAIGFDLATENWDEAAAYVAEAEKMGVDFVWSAEAWGHDAVSPLAFLAARTSRMKLGTGIMQVGTRTPALVVMTALSLASMSHDRFVLGFGTSGPQVIEGWHGFRFERPLQRMREIIEIVRIACTGERLSYQGKFYELPLPGGEGKALRSGARPRPIPIYLATLGPRALEMTGELADGWLGTSFMPEHASVFTDRLAAGAGKAGRSLSDLDLQAGGVVAFGDDVEKLIAPRRAGVAFTLGAMGSREHNFYNQAYQRAGYEDLASKVQEVWLSGDREAAVAMIPDEIVVRTNLVGTEAMVCDRIRAYRNAGITTLRLQPDGKTLDERLQTLGRAVDLVRAVNAEPAAAMA